MTARKKFDKSQLILIVIFVIPTLALAFWMTFAEIWPVSKFVDLQARMSGGYYYPKLTVFVTWACILIPVIIIRALVKGAFDKARFGNNVEAGADGSTTLTITRSSQLFSRLNSVGVFLDGKQIGVVGGGKTKTFSINPGIRTVHAAMGKYKSDPVTITIAPGGTQQMQMGFTADISGLNPPSNALYLR